MATHAAFLPGESPWPGEPGGQQSLGSHKSGTRLSEQQRQVCEEDTALIRHPGAPGKDG